MTLKQYYTTGEAAELLQISRSTISRKFDRGAFFGKKNPITGERMISRESISAFMNQYDLSTDRFNHCLISYQGKSILSNFI